MDGFELAVRAILGQQVTVRAADVLAAKFVAGDGGSAQPSATGDTLLTHAFPRPERLANKEVQLGRPSARTRAISAIAAAVTADQKLLDIGRSLENAITRLRALPGIGEWTAQYIALKGMREPDAFPAADVGLMRALANEAGMRPNDVELLARAEAWRPWRAYAAQHLWAASPTASEKAARSCS